MVAVVAGDTRYESLLEAAAVPTRVSSLTHSFYRYPARFGERFVREAIDSFSRRGDVVLDPFCGGGTTVVEALSVGRCAVACDINALGLLLARVKTSPLSDRQLATIEAWLLQLTGQLAPLLSANDAADEALLIGVPPHYRNFLANLRAGLAKLPRGETRAFGRVLLLKTAQWALDGKEVLPTPTQFVAQLRRAFCEMRTALAEFSLALQGFECNKAALAGRRTLIACSAEEIWQRPFIEGKRSANLVVTSPPYLGVHVLYNKWQVQGRVETRAPYFLAEVADLGSPSRYTLASRDASRADVQDKYFSSIEKSFRSVSRRLSDKGLVIQLVSFADSERALPKYLQAMTSASLEICDVYVSSVGGLSWRRVPGRRWYTRVGAIPDSGAANEVLLVHRKRR